MIVKLENLHKIQEARQRLLGVAAFQLNSAANSCQVLARELAPVRTGFMRDHVTQIKQASDSDLEAIVESAAEYSMFVELGTVRQSSQPFMTPAVESAKRQLLSLGRVF